jgi:hypothetical protein
MKKSNFLILICIIAVPFVIFSKAICEDEDSIFDVLCDINGSLRYEQLFVSILSYVGIFYGYRDIALSSPSIMKYLERHEKSPPLTLL